MTAREAGVTDDRHDELSPAAIERALEPRPLLFVDAAQDAGVDRQQCEIAGLQFEERSSLMSDVDAVQAAQSRRLGHEPFHAAGIGAGQPIIGFDARLYRRARRLWLQEVCVEPFQRIVPVVISGNGVDRLGEPWKGR